MPAELVAAGPSHRNGALRLAAAIARCRREGRIALAGYLPAGYPDAARSRAAFGALAATCDVIEIGLPYSDPVADGPTIAAATAQALQQGCRRDDVLDLVRHVRAGTQAPLLLMAYANTLPPSALAAWQEAGIDGIIVPDAPYEEAGPWREEAARLGLAFCPIVAPTTSDERLLSITATATGFVYVVARVGVTGQGDPDAATASLVARTREATLAPLFVGFGVRAHAHVAFLREAGADGAIVGSRFVQALAGGADPAALAGLARDLGGRA